MSDGKKTTPMTKEAASRIQSTQQQGGHTEKGTFSPRAQSTADKREDKSKDKGGK
jgi:hypothetical protein